MKNDISDVSDVHSGPVLNFTCSWVCSCLRHLRRSGWGRSSHFRFSYLTSSYPQIVASQIFISSIVSSASHLRHICVTSANLRISDPHTSDLHILYLRICITSAHLHISDLYIFIFIVRSSCLETTYLVFTSLDRHHVATLSYLIIFKIHIYNLIY